MNNLKDKKERSKLAKMATRYLANALLLLSIAFMAFGLYLNGFEIFSETQFWVTMTALWQVVIMLILLENFYLGKSD